MRIVVLVKPVPDPASGAERLGPDRRLDRAAAPAVVNGNDEYALEAALKLVEEHGGEVTLVSMAPANAPETMRKALAMGAQRGVHVTDPALQGSDTLSTARVLAAALEGLEFDLVLAGVDTSDGVAGVVPPGVAALRRLPYLSYAAKIEPDPGAGTVRVRRISPTGFDVLEAAMPALISCTQALGEPRYPSLKGIMAARSKEITTLTLADLGIEPGTVGLGGADVTGVVVAADPGPAAQELAGFVPNVLTVTDPATADHAAGMIVAQRLAALIEAHDPDIVMTGAGPEGRDLAGALSALTGWGVLANATAVQGTADGPVATHSVFGGKLITESALTNGKGIITVRPNSVTAEPSGSTGQVEAATVAGELRQPAVPVVDRLDAETKAAQIDDARIIVAGGRGVGGPDGFGLIRDLADALGGAVGATRAAVDSGWIPYSQQIGQTGKIVKPQLYLAMGISGAIQHKVGMQTASTIIAVNRDPDAPIADFADMIVIGDLVEVGNALLAQLRARSG